MTTMSKCQIFADDWDRKLCIGYLEEYMQPDLVDGELNLAPNFPAPPNTDYQGYHNYIDDMMPPESPYLYGLHPNAEIGFLTTTSENLFRTVFEMQPRDAGKCYHRTKTTRERLKYAMLFVARILQAPAVVLPSHAKIKSNKFWMKLWKNCRKNSI